MKVSIIIPVYHVEKYILRCLDSVTQQSFKGEIECILVDDCGSDKSVEIAEQYIHDHSGLNVQFRLIHHTHNQGLSAARNSGIKAATGDYIFFLDSDDAITPDCIAILADLMEKYPQADFAQGNLLDSGGKISHYGFKSPIKEYISNTDELEETILSKVVTSACNRLMKRSMFHHDDMFFPIGMIHEDMYWVYFLSKHVKSAAFTPAGTYVYYTNDNSIMTNANKGAIIKRYQSRLFIAQSIYHDMLSAGQASPRQRQYLAGDITSCMIEVASLHSFGHWMTFWKTIFNMGCKHLFNMNSYQAILFLFLIPPLCFLISIKGWYWRLQHYIVSKI